MEAAGFTVGMHFMAEVHFVAPTHSAAAASRALNMGLLLLDTRVRSEALITVVRSEDTLLADSRAWEASTAEVADFTVAEAAFTEEVDSTVEEGIANATSRYCNATNEMEK